MATQDEISVPNRPSHGPLLKKKFDPEVAAILAAQPDPERPYVYRGTRCHVNKFGILNPPALESVIRCTTRLRAEQLHANLLPGRFDLDHLQAIHRHLFQDVYDWAGEIRVIDFQRNNLPFTEADDAADEIAKLPKDLPPPPNFTTAADIAEQCRRLFDELAAERHLRGVDEATFVERGAYYLKILVLIHPFRDGNGRSSRMFFHHLAAAAGWDLDLDWVSQARRHIAAWRAHCGDDSDFVQMFRESLRGRRAFPEFAQKCDDALRTGAP